jgi:hypothetical protein
MESNKLDNAEGSVTAPTPAPAIRAKFRVDSYETRLATDSRSDANPQEVRQVKLSVVYGDTEENKKYFKWTPSGQITLGLLNPEAWLHLQLGQEVYVDFTPVIRG